MTFCMTKQVMSNKSKPISDSTYSRNQLSGNVYVRKGKLIYQWVKRLCVISGTRLLIYRDKNKNSKPTVVQLAKGSVEEVQIKNHQRCLKLTSSLQGDRSVYLSFTDDADYAKWLRKAKKATAKLPSKADLSNCHLEFLPETVFINEGLQFLNLRHNVLKERPIEEDIYTIGWLDDLPRFYNLRSLNLADNDLHTFPLALCKIKTLTELNIASNKISDLPGEIVEMTSLQILHVHNNHLSVLPEEMVLMKSLSVLVLAFNHFTTVPDILLQSHHTPLSLDSIIMAGNRIERLSHDLLSKMKHIKKIDLRMNYLSLLPKLLTHLDVRDNSVTDLDVRALKALEYLNCERNNMHSLQVNGMSLKNLFAAHNEIESLSINPKPEWLVTMDISHNKLTSLPSWLSECFFMVKVNASHNKLSELPDRFFVMAPKLKIIKLDIENPVVEELHLDHNLLEDLPYEFLYKSTKLRYLNLTKNKLTVIPKPNSNESLNRLQELYLSANQLEDAAVSVVCCFTRLRILHLAHNKITIIHNRDIAKLESLQELNVSGNVLRSLPASLGKHSKLQCLRANTNLLRELPDFKNSPNLKALDVGSNRLSDVSMTNLMSSQVNLLDISGNPDIMLDTGELGQISNWKKICTVDMTGQNRSLLDIRQAPYENTGQPWQTGLSLTSGMRNKKLKSIGQKVGAASAICHIRKSIESSSHYMLNVANVGDTEVIISRRGEAVPMSRLFLIHSDREERQRICKSDGIVTEDGRVDGVTFCTRLIGGSYLFPHVLPEPHVTSLNLHPDDQLIIIANNGLWKYISYQDAVNEIMDIPDPVIAAKRLQDLAQGYGSRESIGVLVIRLLLSDEERTKMKGLLQNQFHNEQSIIAQLREKDLEREAERKRRKASEMSDDVPMDIVKLKGPGKKRMQANELFSEDVDGVYVKLKYGPENVIANPSNWETILQRRLTEEVKNMELQSVFGSIDGEDLDAKFGPNETPDNWTASIQKTPKHTVYPNPTPCKPIQPTQITHVQSLIEPSISTESVEFRKEYKMPINLDRDAVLFHEMQMARARNHGTSTDSMASTQSVPASVSFKDIETRSKSSSHSIEVLIRPPSLSPTQASYGGSFPTSGTINNRVMSLDRKGRIPGSCPDVVPQDHIDEAPIIQDEDQLDHHSDEVNNKINEMGDNFIGTKVDLN
ncbi:hypothetical protein KUTeg_018887 [Tegillarca granosa]|uniref:PH domain-containing protein n=1 Tax=Tegillarca granosa TaxID=220873 RepID=A0ABQ9EDJ7_TEGGR|nr:hypothetical protein KUTeg_018887 [Tegillarca granosa]